MKAITEHIKAFNSQSDYLAYKTSPGLSGKTVSLVIDDNIIHYEK